MNGPLYPQAELLESYRELSQTLQTLAQHLRHSQLPIWVPLTETERQNGVDAREKAIRLYCDLWYQDRQDGRATRSCHGLVAADPPTLEACQQVNKAKIRFRRAVQAVKGQQQRHEWLDQCNRRDPGLRQDLNHKGLGRLHLKQCYRLLPMIEAHPCRVGFNWYCSGRSIRKISVAEVEKKLVAMGMDKPHVQLYHRQLSQLQQSTPLAQVQQQAPLMRANLRFNVESSTEDRNAMNLSLPLIFAWDARQGFPEYNQPPLTPPAARQRQVRSDCRLEPEPFIAPLRIHRYRRTQ